MALSPYEQAISRAHFVDALGSGLIMYRDLVGGKYTELATLTPGKLTDAARVANTDLLQYPGAKIVSKDSGILYEVINGAWVATAQGVQQIEQDVIISGIPGGSNTLTAVIGFAYAGSATYQWTRNGAAIGGATNQTYVQNQATDGGKRIGCTVSGITPKFSSLGVIIPGIAPVQLTGTPTTTGETNSFTPFTVSAAQGLPAYTYSLVNAPGGMAVDSSGVVTWSSPAAGSYNAIVVRVTDSLGNTADITFNLTIAQSAAAPVNSVAPVVSGTAQVGQTLTTTNGTWTGSPSGYIYQWKRGATNVGTNQNTYVPVTGDIGSAISCVVTATNGVGSTSQASNSTANVIAASSITTNPKYGYGVANAAGDANLFATIFGGMTNLAGSAPAGRAGTFSTVASATDYVWLAVLASSVGSGMHVFDGTGFGGFDGANSAGNFVGVDADPMIVFKTYTDTAGNVWNMYRSDYKATTFGPFTVS